MCRLKGERTLSYKNKESIPGSEPSLCLIEIIINGPMYCMPTVCQGLSLTALPSATHHEVGLNILT